MHRPYTIRTQAVHNLYTENHESAGFGLRFLFVVNPRNQMF